MTKYGAPEIVGSVGKGGHNIPTDVQIVQELLNDYVEPPMDFLPVTGRCCPQTIQTIVWFQKVNLGHKWPDGRVDPNGETIMYLSQFRILSPSSPDDKWSDNTSPPRKIHPPNATPQQANLFQNRMREVFKNAGWEGEWGTFWDELIHSDIPLVQTIIAGMATGQNATLIAKTYITLRRAEIGRQSALNIIKGTLNSLRPDPFFTTLTHSILIFARGISGFL